MDNQQIHRKILTTNELTIGYPVRHGESNRILSDLNLEVHAGQVVCILGPNGSGKSTLLRTAAGIQPSLEGSVQVLGQEVNTHHHNKLARLLSVVLTERIDVLNLSVYQLVSMGRYPHNDWLGRLRAEDKIIIERSLEQVHLSDFMHREVNELSDGEQQRVMIAKALAQDTPLIILDEPTAHLDLPNRVEIMGLLRDLSTNTGKAIILSSHDLDLALQSADWIWLIPKGGPIIQGMPEDLVLNGSFEATFDTSKVHFDPSSGSFQIDYQPEKTIYYEGNSITGFWTKRAMAREGYRMVEDSNAENRLIMSENYPRWTYMENGKSTVFKNIFQLMRYINRF